MNTRRDVLRFASLASAAGWTLALPQTTRASETSVTRQGSTTHTFHAEAAALRGQVIRPLAFISLHPEGGYSSQHASAFTLPSVVSFSSAYTQVSGTTGRKQGGGWGTLTTAIVENLNISNVVFADRVVAQIFTEHPSNGYVPSVSFLGTHFENLQVAGRKIEPHFDFGVFGEKPSGDIPYTSDAGFQSRVQLQSANLAAQRDLSPETLVRYSGAQKATAGGDEIEFSLIQSAGPGLSSGHVINVPGFGSVHLAAVKLVQEDYRNGTPLSTTVELTMIQAQTSDGPLDVAPTKTNGPGGHK